MQSPSDEVVSDAIRWIIFHLGFFLLLFASMHTNEVKVRMFIIISSVTFIAYTIGTSQSTWSLALTVTWNALIISIQSFRVILLILTRRRSDRQVFKEDLLYCADGLPGDNFDQYWNEPIG
jgi:hypothetical protein